jgi:hypothetical protein
MGIGCRGQGEAGNIRKIIHQRPQEPVVGTEIMPPFGHAMRLINREKRDFAFTEQPPEFEAVRPFRRDI